MPRGRKEDMLHFNDIKIDQELLNRRLEVPRLGNLSRTITETVTVIKKNRRSIIVANQSGRQTKVEFWMIDNNNFGWAKGFCFSVPLKSEAA